MDCSTPGLPVHHQLPEFTQTRVYWVIDAINYLILCCPLLLLSSIFPSIRVFSNKSVLCIRWQKFWSFSLNISPSKNIQDWFPLGWTGLISLQSKGLSRVFSNTTVLWTSIWASIPRHSGFFTVQLSHPFMTTGKTIALTRWTFDITWHYITWQSSVSS